MIYVFCGDDTKNKLENYEKFIKSISKDTQIFTISRNNFNKDQIESLYSGSSLFFAKNTVLFQGVLENEETREFFLSRLKLISESINNFILLESKVTKVLMDALKKVGAEIKSFELPKEKKEKFNNFLLANAFGDKDKLNLWIYFRQAVDKGVGLEELVGVLFWKIKDMILKKNFSKIKEDRLKELSSNISYLLPRARQEGIDAEVALEKFLLEVF